MKAKVISKICDNNCNNLVMENICGTREKRSYFTLLNRTCKTCLKFSLAIKHTQVVLTPIDYTGLYDSGVFLKIPLLYKVHHPDFESTNGFSPSCTMFLELLLL